MGEIYNRQDRVPEARKTLQHCGAANPTDSTCWMALGRLEEQEGDNAAAEAAYRAAVGAEDTAPANLRLAQFLQRAARVQEAEQVLKHVDTLRPMPVSVADFDLSANQPQKAAKQYFRALMSRVSPEAGDRKTAVVAARLIEAQLEKANAAASTDERALAVRAASALLDRY